MGAAAAAVLALAGGGLVAAATTAGASVEAAATASDTTAGAQRSAVGTRATRAQRKLRLSLVVNPKGDVQYGTKVTVRASTRDQNGVAIKGASVRFRWSMPGKITSDTRTSSSKGVAVSQRTVIDAGPYTCTIKVQASWKGQVKSATASLQVYGSC
jgi:hypothetical protein